MCKVNKPKRFIKCTKSIQIIPSEHFPLRMIQRRFDLSILSSMHSFIESVKVGFEIEITDSTETSTILVEKVAENTIKVISGWKKTRDNKSIVWEEF